MDNSSYIQEIFFKYLSQLEFDEKSLNYNLINKHKAVLQTLSNIGNSGTGIFDLHKREVVFYSSNFGLLLGYQPSDYEFLGQRFFAEKIHPEDIIKCSINGVAALKILNNLPELDKLSHKLVSEYRMLNSKKEYVRLIEQYQVLELDAKGQIWLMLNIVDISSNQAELDGSQSQLLNFRTGSIIPIKAPEKLQFELTKRELEILKLVKGGFLSKEISNQLSISVHTVNTHRQRFLEKLGANNSLEALSFASKFGLID